MKPCITCLTVLFAAFSTFATPYALNNVVFSQDFTSSANVNDYVGTGANQLDYIRTGSSGTDTITPSITGNKLLFTETGSSDATGATAGIGKVTAIDLQGSQLVQYKFTMSLANLITGTENAFASLTFSPGTSADWSPGTATDSTLNSFGSVNIRTIAAGGGSWCFRSPTLLVNSPTVAANGSLVSLYVVAYAKSGTWGETVDYTDPTGATSSIALGEYDMWVDTGSGATLLGTQLTNLAVGNAPDKFKFFYGTTAGREGDVAFDSVTVNVIPEPATMGMLLFGGSAVLILRRMRK